MSIANGNNKEKLSAKEFWGVIKWVFKIYYKISPTNTILMIVSKTITDIRPLIYGYLYAVIIDKILFIAQQKGSQFNEIIPYLITLLIYFLFATCLMDVMRNYAIRSLRFLSRSKLEEYIYEQVNRIGIQTLENPETANLIQRCQQWIYNTFDLLQESVGTIAGITKTIVSAYLIISFFPIMIPVLIIITIIKYFPDKKFMQKDFHWQVDNSEERRRIYSSAYSLQEPTSLQEISIVGAYKYLSKKYTKFFDWWNKGMLKIIKDREIVTFLLMSLDNIISVIGYGVIINNYFLGRISLGIITFQMRALDSFSSSMETILYSVSFMNELSVKMKDLVDLMNMQPAVKDGDIKLPRLITPPSIEFRKVSFKYPGSDKYVFKNLDLKINSGEKIALVGHNGAGKTTLIKLIARIYAATEGEILINGENINNLTIDDWYKNLGILFQDYNFYKYLSAKENIYIGKSVKKINMKKVIEAAKNADAHEFIMKFTHGYDEIMSEQYKGGTRPSTGQAQKIAIARFFYRNAPLAIFDEPTAAIDAVSEYNIFNKIYKFFINKTVIIISHRFSTVRNADRIIVLRNGKIIEEGKHRQLLRKEGEYAKAYKLQAEGYNDTSGNTENVITNM